MKNTKEMIEVMQAYDRGEQIEVKALNETDGWVEIKDPWWDWHNLDYRVKPKTKYIPFDTAEEFLAAQRVHGNVSICSGRKQAYINACGRVVIILDEKIYSYLTLDDLFSYEYKFSDGTPFGKEVE